MNSSAIIPSPTNALAFGSRDDIRELAERITKMMVGNVKLTTAEALTVAQVAVAHGLDPFNGEVWGLKRDDGTWYGVMVGIKGLRKCARRQAESEGGSYWIEFARVEPTLYNAPADAVVYECRLRDAASIQAYSRSIHTLTQSGIPYKDAVNMLGSAPMTIGIGIATPQEKSKLSIHARARKRAEADAIKQRYDVHLIGIGYVSGDDIPNDVMPYDEMPIIDASLQPKVGIVDEMPIVDASLQPKQERPYDPETARARISDHANMAAAKGWQPGLHDRNMIAVNLEACFPGNGAEEKRHAVLKWLTGAASVKDLSDGQVVAIKKWLNAQPDSGGQWLPDPMSVQEAQAIYRLAIQDEGQLALNI